MPSLYPVHSAERSRWIIEQRPARMELDSQRPYAFLVEEECAPSEEIVSVATVFLTNRECPWRCLMCDLWKNTLTEPLPRGAIPQQIDYALAQLPPARQIKLYNSGSFFDSHAIPVEDYPAIASTVRPFERVIVESHPALVGENCLRFRDLIPSQLEVAMGLETVHPDVLDQLNKRMTLDQFATAAETLRANKVDLRVFILVQPPFMKASEALFWAERSLDFAFECGATAATLIPTRAGNGAMEFLQQQGEFAPPRLEVVEASINYGLALKRGRVFVDLWDIRNRSTACLACHAERMDRLYKMNLSQVVSPPIVCWLCKGHS